MDFVFGSGIVGIQNHQVLLSYDVICQWKKKFFSERIHTLPPRIRPTFGPDAIQFGVPKFHLPPHESACQAPHSMNYKPGVGQTDGESIERNWSTLNGAAASTREMGPGSRHDTLDDHCGHGNWRKLTTLGTPHEYPYDVRSHHNPFLPGSLLLRRLTTALAEAKVHIEVLDEFTAELNEEDTNFVALWRADILEWERGEMGAKSPYDVEGEGRSRNID